jgi:Na+-transporting NADH:ubiquinone oxidoreductase subunit F
MRSHFIFSSIGIDWELSLYATLAFVIIGIALVLAILWIKKRFATGGVCKLYINDNEEMTKIVPAGLSLLSALTHEGIPIPSPCGGKATCKQCKVQVVKDADEPLETDCSTFSKKQLKEGWRLSCQTKVNHDLSLHIEESLTGVKEWECTVTSNNNVATFIKELAIELPKGEHVNYRSGGYLQIHVPPFKTNTDDWKATIDPKFWDDWQKYGLFGKTVDFSNLEKEQIRAYSMASYPAEKEKLLFNIRIATPPFVAGKVSDTIPWGMCSSYAFSLQAGDKVKVSGPYGESYMINDSRDLYFLIGGAGSSFARSHILHLFRTENTKRRVSLWYGARALRENIYQEEYETLAKEFKNFSYNLVLSEPLPEDIEQGWPKNDPIKTNFLFRAFEQGELKKLDAPEECLFYVCGPPLHNKSILKLLDDYGVPRESIVLDDFGS